MFTYMYVIRYTHTHMMTTFHLFRHHRLTDKYYARKAFNFLHQRCLKKELTALLSLPVEEQFLEKGEASGHLHLTSCQTFSLQISVIVTRTSFRFVLQERADAPNLLILVLNRTAGAPSKLGHMTISVLFFLSSGPLLNA